MKVITFIHEKNGSNCAFHLSSCKIILIGILIGIWGSRSFDGWVGFNEWRFSVVLFNTEVHNAMVQCEETDTHCSRIATDNAALRRSFGGR